MGHALASTQDALQEPGGRGVQRRRSKQCGDLGLPQPEQAFDAKLFDTETIRGERHELFSRPAIGLSTLVGSLHGTMINLQEAPDLCAKHSIEEANKVLNVQDCCARVLVEVVLPYRWV